MFTRKQYMNHECSHSEYYAQFVTEGVIRCVAQAIGKDRIMASRDNHFNDIPLKQWDSLNGAMKSLCNQKAKKEAEPIKDNPHAFMWSLSDAVCIAKEAARIIKEGK